jgi:hypothetical protein
MCNIYYITTTITGYVHTTAAAIMLFLSALLSVCGAFVGFSWIDSHNCVQSLRLLDCAAHLTILPFAVLCYIMLVLRTRITQQPKTAIGMIVAALRQRREKHTPSFTVLSCDNLPGTRT